MFILESFSTAEYITTSYVQTLSLKIYIKAFRLLKFSLKLI